MDLSLERNCSIEPMQADAQMQERQQLIAGRNQAALENKVFFTFDSCLPLPSESQMIPVNLPSVKPGRTGTQWAFCASARNREKGIVIMLTDEKSGITMQMFRIKS